MSCQKKLFAFLELQERGGGLQLVEHIFFDKGTDDFFMKFYRTRETDGSAGQTLDSGSQGQIVTLNVLSKNLTSQMLLLR